MSVTIIKQGLLDTIQDEGRYGFQHLGINPGGSMDMIASSVANMLVGNKKNEAVIELHFPASWFQFNEDSLIAISGADFYPTINDEAIPINTAVFVVKDSVLKLIKNNKQSRCYLAVNEGWKVDKWLNSYSTNLKAKTGGYKGRPLKNNDKLEMKTSSYTLGSFIAKVLPVNVNMDSFYNISDTIRCIQGSEYDWLTDEAKKKLELTGFQISLQSDRMGYRLKGDNLLQRREKDLLSSAVTRGTIQLLPSGQLIILMADHQTTGGYPKVAHVISADFSTLAQKSPNEEIHFRLVSHTEAEQAFIKQQQQLHDVEQEIESQRNKFFQQ